MKPEILLVEDNELLQAVIPPLLKKYGYQVSLAINGQEALEMSTFKYDLILLDLLLPDISGVDVYKKIRAIEIKSGNKTPIIAYTAIGDCMKQECMDAGFDDVFVKDDPQKLIYALQKWFLAQ